jgi:hypothetical protein
VREYLIGVDLSRKKLQEERIGFCRMEEGIESISGPAATGPLTNVQKTLYMV